MRVAHLPQRHGINEIDVARDERGERFFGIAPGVFLQQGQVVIQHVTHTFTLVRKGNRLSSQTAILSGYCKARCRSGILMNQFSENIYCAAMGIK